MNLLEFRDLVIVDIREKLAPIKLESHGGRFDFAELDTYAVSAPEIRVAVLAARRDPNRWTHWNVDFAAYPISGGDRHMKAGERGLTMATTLISFLNDYEPQFAGRPGEIGYQNLYSSEARDRNKHLSAITWRQQVSLVGSIAPAPLGDFLRLVATYSPQPLGSPHGSDDITLPQE